MSSWTHILSHYARGRGGDGGGGDYYVIMDDGLRCRTEVTDDVKKDEDTDGDDANKNVRGHQSNCHIGESLFYNWC